MFAIYTVIKPPPRMHDMCSKFASSCSKVALSVLQVCFMMYVLAVSNMLDTGSIQETNLEHPSCTFRSGLITVYIESVCNMCDSCMLSRVNGVRIRPNFITSTLRWRQFNNPKVQYSPKVLQFFPIHFHRR